MMLDHIAAGADCAGKAQEVAAALRAAATLRMVRCPNGRVVLGYGEIGLLDAPIDGDLAVMQQGAQARRDEILALAMQGPEKSVSFIRI